MTTNIKKQIEKKVKENGGYTNCHSHLSRAYTFNVNDFKIANYPLQEKWKLIQSLKKNMTEEEIYTKIAQSVISQINRETTTILTFLDVDEYTQYKDIDAFEKIKKDFHRSVNLLSANQTLSGVINQDAKKWFDIGADYCDIIGSLPKKDKGQEEKHLDIIFDTAKRFRKKVHIHTDQFNTSSEKETELILDKIIKHKMEGQVTLIHCISLSCHHKEYRHKIYKKIEETNTNVVCCPKIWLDSPRSEELAPIHNSMTPVDELLEYDINIGLGTDNVYDLFGCLNDGNMYDELKTLAMGLRIYDFDTLIHLATKSGRNILY